MSLGSTMALTLVHDAPHRPRGLNGGTLSYSPDDLAYIVSQFQVDVPIQLDDFPEKGNINLHTYWLKDSSNTEYLLQKVNSNVFTRPYRVMDSMMASISAQNKGLEVHPEDWVPITLVPTRFDSNYLDISDEHGWSVWRLMHRIPDVVTFKSLGAVSADKRDHVAFQVGRGLALYSELTASMPANLASPLPGYRHTDIYFMQLDAVLAGVRGPHQAIKFLPEDEELQEATGLHFMVHLSPEEAEARREAVEPWVDFLMEHRGKAMILHNSLQSGLVRKGMIHGDTKIENFLFCKDTYNVKSLIDLDTIVPGTWLSDWGDMVRSLVNVAGETEEDLANVVVCRETYETVTRGFLSAAGNIPPQELSLMVDAVISITLELGARFLADYLRGDTYFGVTEGHRDLNLTRAAVQLSLAQSLMDYEHEARAMIAAHS
jgi:hypothetical protein